MKRSSGIRQEIRKRCSVETVKERAENRALWNTGRNGSRRREMRVYRNRMRAVMKIRRKNGKSRTRNTKVGRESGKEDLVVDSVVNLLTLELFEFFDTLSTSGVINDPIPIL